MPITLITLGLYALLWLLLSLAGNPWFFLGGTLACGALALRQLRASNVARTAATARSIEAQQERLAP